MTSTYFEHRGEFYSLQHVHIQTKCMCELLTYDMSSRSRRHCHFKSRLAIKFLKLKGQRFQITKYSKMFQNHKSMHEIRLLLKNWSLYTLFVPLPFH